MFGTFRSTSSRTMLSQHAVEIAHSHPCVSANSEPNAQSTTPGKGQRLLLGLVFSSMIALLARRRRSLTRSGAGGTIAVGTTIFGMGGWSWGLSLVYFFVSSTLFSHYREREKARTVGDKFSKGSERDIGQVAANGGLATLLALAYGLTGSLPFRKLNCLTGATASTSSHPRFSRRTQRGATARRHSTNFATSRTLSFTISAGTSPPPWRSSPSRSTSRKRFSTT